MFQYCVSCAAVGVSKQNWLWTPNPRWWSWSSLLELKRGKENSGLCQQAFPGCPVWAEGNPGLWAVPLLGLICFQTKALLTLLILEKFRGHQRKGVRVKGWKYCGLGAWESVCLCGTDAQRCDWKCFTSLPGKSEVEMLHLHRGRCQELQFSTKQKAEEYFGTRAYLRLAHI